MALTDIDIINGALNLFGANTISSLDEGSREAQVASIFYDDVYDKALAMHPWSFAKAKVQLAQLASAPLNEWQYAYQLPTDLVRLISTNVHQDYEILEDNLYADSATIQIEYITRIDESKLPRWFKMYVMYELAANICVGITSNRTMAADFKIQADENLREAKFINDDQEPPVAWVDNPFIDVRG